MKRSARSWYSSVSLASALVCAAGNTAAARNLPDSSEVAATDLRPTLFAVSVNGTPAGEPTMLLEAEDGTLFAPEEALRSWRLKPWKPALQQDGVAYYALDGVSGLEMEVVRETQSLMITASAALLETTTVTARSRDVVPMTPSAIGGFLNYDLVAQLVSGKAHLNGVFETGAFTPRGVALASFVGRWNDRGAGLTRLETSWTRDDPERMRSLRFGDSISRGALGSNPVRFAGFQAARDFSTQPGFVTIPLPTVRGESEVPSVVDVYVNNVLAETRELPPGPFEIESIPVITGGGEVQLVVRDLLGRETLVRERYYTARQLLRRGLLDYSIEAGFLRQGFGKSSFDYGSPMAAATYRYGFSDDFTGEFHVEASPKARMGGVGGSVALGEIGVLNAAGAISHSDRGVGTRYEVGFESSTPRLSYGAIAELISDDFVSVGTAALDRRPPRLTLQAFAGIPLEFGSLGLSYILRDTREQADVEFLGASASVRLGRWGSLHLTGRKSLSGPGGDALLLSLTMPLGAATSASVSGEMGAESLFRASLQKSLPTDEGVGFRAAAQLGAIDRFDGRLSYQADFGNYDLDLSWVDSQTGVRMTVSGGIGGMGDGVFASRKLTQSFATVKVADYAGVRIYADNQQVGTTDESGVAVIPRLRPFERNSIAIEVADLPIDVEIDASKQVVRPYDRSGVALAFGVRPARGAIVTLVRENGVAVPAGAAVRLDGSDEEFVVAPGGEAYLTGLGLLTRGLASWQTGSCSFEVSYPERGEPQPRLGPLACLENDR